MPVQNPYETESLVNEYLLFHYGAPEEILPYPSGPHDALHFPVRSVTELVDWDRLSSRRRALDLGCAVGRASYTLSESFDEVLGIDFSQAFVNAANQIGAHGELPYHRLDQGAITTALTAKLPPATRPDRVRFQQGDAMDLPEDIGTFDLALLANLICRLPQPKRCLERLPNLIRHGGQLLITSPYTWLDDFTPSEHWIGGRPAEDGSAPIYTIDALRDALEPNFECVQTKDLPMLIREHARKYQWTVAEGSLWLRRR